MNKQFQHKRNSKDWAHLWRLLIPTCVVNFNSISVSPLSLLSHLEWDSRQDCGVGRKIAAFISPWRKRLIEKEAYVYGERVRKWAPSGSFNPTKLTDPCHEHCKYTNPSLLEGIYLFSFISIPITLSPLLSFTHISHGVASRGGLSI